MTTETTAAATSTLRRTAPARRRPLILLTPDLIERPDAPTENQYVVRANYAAAIAEAGGMPMILPFHSENIAAALVLADGVVITGARPGVAVAEPRQRFERQLVDEALKAGKPLLGICHGMQLIGECLGGEFVTELPASKISHLPDGGPNQFAHEVMLAPGSDLVLWAGSEVQQVNSLHGHALAGEGRFRVVARATDGVIEAFEGETATFCLGIQWHPEYRLTPLDCEILRAFVERSAGNVRRGTVDPVHQRLSALGLTLPQASQPPGAFVGAIRSGDIVTVSGQVPLVDGRVWTTGIVGSGVSMEEGRDCARLCLLNALAQLEQAAGGFDKVCGFIRLAGYVAASADFVRHGAVIDGASELLRELFPDRWTHARIAIGVASLPRGAPVELELTALVVDEA